MPDYPAPRTATILTILSLLTVNLAMASPDRVRHRAAGFVQSVAVGQCDIAASLVDWPLKLRDESIQLDAWQSPCERLRARLITARIDAVFQSDELTSTMPPRQLERENVYFVDLVMSRRPGHEQVSGMNLAFECSEADFGRGSGARPGQAVCARHREGRTAFRRRHSRPFVGRLRSRPDA